MQYIIHKQSPKRKHLSGKYPVYEHPKKTLCEVYKYGKRKGKTDKENLYALVYYKFGHDYMNRCMFEFFKGSIRSVVASAFNRRGYKKNSRTHEIIGCEWEFLKQFFEKKFTQGMNWENQGKWHIDHIVPMASARTEEDVIRLNHYTNLQPLWAKDNLSKGSKIIKPVQTKMEL